jgi:hypothetical protein
MRTSVVKTILDDSISGNKIHGGAISGLASLESALVYVTGGSGSFIKATTIGSISTPSDRANIYCDSFAAFGSVSMISAIGPSTLFSVVDSSSGARDPILTMSTVGSVFALMRNSTILFNPTSMRLMTTTSPSSPYVARCGGGWYFEGEVSVSTITARSYITINAGQFTCGGGISMTSLVSQHLLINAWWTSWNATARTTIAGISSNGATSCVNLGAIGSAIDTPTWALISAIDQPLSTNDDVHFNSVSTQFVKIDSSGIALDYVNLPNHRFDSAKSSYSANLVVTSDSENMLNPGTVLCIVNYKHWGSIGQILIPEFTEAIDISSKTQIVANTGIAISYEGAVLLTNKILIASHFGVMNNVSAFGNIFARKSSTDTLEIIFEFHYATGGPTDTTSAFNSSNPYNPTVSSSGLVGLRTPIYAAIPLALQSIA